MSWPALSLIPIAVMIAGCADTPLLAPASVPASIQTPPGVGAYLKTYANGVQIYECSRKNDSTYEWAFKSPQATLSDSSGHVLGKHYAGPTWEANDGSSVVGETKARDPGPNPTAIPWLLLTPKSQSGSGTFADTKFVQRLATVGGIAPAQGCSETTLKQQVQVPYTAAYVFYR